MLLTFWALFCLFPSSVWLVCKMGALELVLALCTLSLQLPGYKLNLNDRKTGVCLCACVCVCLAPLTLRLLFDLVYDALKSTTLKGLCITAWRQKAHPWHHFTHGASKVHSAFMCDKNREDNDDESPYVGVFALYLPPCISHTQTLRWLTSIVSYAMTSLLYSHSTHNTAIF